VALQIVNRTQTFMEAIFNYEYRFHSKSCIAANARKIPIG
jgi:hypothetical protein